MAAMKAFAAWFFDSPAFLVLVCVCIFIGSRSKTRRFLYTFIAFQWVFLTGMLYLRFFA